MAKIGFGEGGFKGFVVRHVEKMVFGVVVAVFLLLVWLGISKEAFTKTPDQLAKDAEAAVSNINNAGSWSAIGEQYQTKTSYERNVELGRKPTEEERYPLANPLKPQLGKPPVRRGDPKLLAPKSIEVRAMTGALAIRMPEFEPETTPWDNDKDTKPKTTKKKKKKESKNRGGGYGEGMAGMSDMPGGGMPGMGGDEASAGMGGYGVGGGGMPGMDGMAGGYGMGGMGMGMGGMSSTAMKGYRPNTPALAEESHFVVVTSLWPITEQLAEFEKALGKGMGISRDRPRALTFTAERADVTNNPDKELTEEDWDKKWRLTPQRAFNQIRNKGWHGFSMEVADPRYLQPGVLTMPIPPILMEDMALVAVHSEIPKMSDLPPMPEFQKPEAKSDDEVDELPIAAPGMQGMGAGGMGGYGAGMPGMSGMAGMPGMPGMEGGMGGYGAGMPGMPGMDGGMGGYGAGMPGMPGMDGGMGGYGAGMPGMPGMDTAGVSGGYGGGMPGMPGMDGGMGGYGGGMPGMDGSAYGMPGMAQIDNIMVRFFDFDVKPGRKYRYRIQLGLEDPNHPQHPGMDPNKRALSDEVLLRVRGLEHAESAETKGIKNEMEKMAATFKARLKNSIRRTPWSDPSPVADVEPPSRVLAGKVTPVKPTAEPKARGGALSIAEPTGTVMALAWEPTRAVKVPGVHNVGRGAYLNFKANVDVAHPVMLNFKTIENFEINVNSLVLDMRGGEEIPNTGKEPRQPINVPAEFIILDARGSLMVRNELDDQPEYKGFLPPEIEAPAGGGMGMPGDADGGGMPGYGGGMPGDDGGGGGRRRGRRAGDS